MINNNIIREIENLRHHTDDKLRDIQITKIPCIYNLNYQIEKKYIYNNEVNNFNTSRTLIIKVGNLPITESVKDKSMFKDSMINVINKQYVQPFILFLDGEFIKWSDMTIVYDKYAYILVNTDKVYPDCQIIVFPYNVTYIEGDTRYIVDDFSFQFNNSGLLASSSDINITRISIKDSRYLIAKASSLIPNSKNKININESYKISKDNLIFFKDGKLYTDNNYMQFGLNNFILDNGNYLVNQIRYKFFYYIFGNVSKDNILSIKNKTYLDSKINENTIPDYVSELSKSFNFNYDKDKKYTTNIMNSLEYISSYNIGLFNNIYKQKSNIEFFEYTGLYIKSISKSGYVSMSRLCKNNKEGFPLIFINGVLYKYYHFIQYNGNMFTFPIIDIKDSDSIEIMIYRNVDNRIIKTFIPSYSSDTFELDPDIDIEYLKIFSNDTPNPEFNIPHSDTLKYEVKFLGHRVRNDYVNVKLLDSYYYNRELYFVSSRQFRYFYMFNKKDNNISVNLPQEFSYCNDNSRYIVFLNGIKLNHEDYRVTIINENRPFHEHSIYINIPMKINDKIEVFYVPDEFNEISIIPNIPIEGTICIDRTKITYNFSKELYMVFINGKKVKKSQISDIDSNRIKILNSVKSVNNICIVKYINDDDILSELYKDIDSMTLANNSISNVEFETLYNMGLISNTEAINNSTKLDMRNVLKAVIKDYYLRTTTISNNDVMVYDFDKSISNTVDADGNIIVDYYNN